MSGGAGTGGRSTPPRIILYKYLWDQRDDGREQYLCALWVDTKCEDVWFQIGNEMQTSLVEASVGEIIVHDIQKDEKAHRKLPEHYLETMMCYVEKMAKHHKKKLLEKEEIDKASK